MRVARPQWKWYKWPGMSCRWRYGDLRLGLNFEALKLEDGPDDRESKRYYCSRLSCSRCGSTALNHVCFPTINFPYMQLRASLTLIRLLLHTKRFLDLCTFSLIYSARGYIFGTTYQQIHVQPTCLSNKPLKRINLNICIREKLSAWVCHVMWRMPEVRKFTKYR